MSNTFVILKENTWLTRENGNDFGWGNGYVALPKGHQYFDVEYNDINIHVHGGLTYSEMEGDFWVVGFDTNHFGDTLEKWPVEKVLVEVNNLKEKLDIPINKELLIYLIKQEENNPYDSYDSHVVVAENENQVRDMAKLKASGEGREVWDNATIIKLGKYTGTGEPYIVLSSFHAG